MLEGMAIIVHGGIPHCMALRVHACDTMTLIVHAYGMAHLVVHACAMALIVHAQGHGAQRAWWHSTLHGTRCACMTLWHHDTYHAWHMAWHS